MTLAPKAYSSSSLKDWCSWYSVSNCRSLNSRAFVTRLRSTAPNLSRMMLLMVSVQVASGTVSFARKESS